MNQVKPTFNPVKMKSFMLLKKILLFLVLLLNGYAQQILYVPQLWNITIDFVKLCSEAKNALIDAGTGKSL